MKMILFLWILLPAYNMAQHTLKLPAGENPPPAELQQMAWIQGSWTGEAFGGITEEVWTKPMGGSMMFVFKLIENDNVKFYEFGHIRQESETLLLQLKHFNADISGWEQKDESVDFRLVKLEENHAYFEDMTFERVSENEMNVYVVLGEDGSEGEVKFNFKKQ